MNKNELYTVKPLYKKEQVEVAGGYAPRSPGNMIDPSGSPKIPNMMEDIKCW